MWTIRQILSKFPVWCAWFFILLDFCWEAPQVIAGAVVKLVYIRHGLREVDTYRQGTCQIQNWNMTSGVSLGWFQFTHPFADKDTCSHEVGHSVESLVLGPLYLVVIGLPSLLWAGIIHPYFMPNKSYYWFYTERITDRIAGIADR